MERSSSNGLMYQTTTDSLNREKLVPSLFTPLGRGGVTLKSFGKNYLTDAYNPSLRLLATPDGPEVHIYNFDPDHPATHTGCVLRPGNLDQNPALHACWGPEYAPNLLAIAWSKVLIIYHVEHVEKGTHGSCVASGMGEVTLNRKPSGLSWCPHVGSIPTLALYDITEILFVQCPRDRKAGEEPDVVYSAFSPSLPGALECVSWSQWGKHLGVCMEGILRIYDWPSHVCLDDFELNALPHCDTRLRKRVRAIRQAGCTSFVATTDTDLSLLESIAYSHSGYFSSSGGGLRRGPIRATQGASLHLIHVPDVDQGVDPNTRLVDIETGIVTHVAMPDLLAVRAFGGPNSGSERYALAAVGSHTSDTITVYRIEDPSPAALGSSGNGQQSKSITGIFSILLPPSTRPKGITFIGSRLVLLAGAREGSGATVGASNYAEFNLHLAVYSLPPSVYSSSWRASLPVIRFYRRGGYPSCSSSAPNSPAHSIHSHYQSAGVTNTPGRMYAGGSNGRLASSSSSYCPYGTTSAADHHHHVGMSSSSSSSSSTYRPSPSTSRRPVLTPPPPSLSPSLGSALDLRPSSTHNFSASSSLHKGSPIRADRHAASNLSLSGYLADSGGGHLGASSGSSSMGGEDGGVGRLYNSPARGLPASPSGPLIINGVPAERPPSAGRLMGLGKGKESTIRRLSTSHTALSSTLNVLPSATSSLAGTPRSAYDGPSHRGGGTSPSITPSSSTIGLNGHASGWGGKDGQGSTATGGLCPHQSYRISNSVQSSPAHGPPSSSHRPSSAPQQPRPSSPFYSTTDTNGNNPRPPSPFHSTERNGHTEEVTSSAVSVSFPPSPPPAFCPEPSQHDNSNPFHLHPPPKDQQQQQQKQPPMYNPSSLPISNNHKASSSSSNSHSSTYPPPSYQQHQQQHPPSPNRSTPSTSSPAYALERVLSAVAGLSEKMDTGLHRVETAIHEHGNRLGVLEQKVFSNRDQQNTSNNSVSGNAVSVRPPSALSTSVGGSSDQNGFWSS